MLLPFQSLLPAALDVESEQFFVEVVDRRDDLIPALVDGRQSFPQFFIFLVLNLLELFLMGLEVFEGPGVGSQIFGEGVVIVMVWTAVPGCGLVIPLEHLLFMQC